MLAYPGGMLTYLQKCVESAKTGYVNEFRLPSDRAVPS